MHELLPDTTKGSKSSTFLLRWTSTWRCVLFLCSLFHFFSISSLTFRPPFQHKCSSGSAVAYGRGGDRGQPEMFCSIAPVEDVPYVSFSLFVPVSHSPFSQLSKWRVAQKWSQFQSKCFASEYVNLNSLASVLTNTFVLIIGRALLEWKVLKT